LKQIEGSAELRQQWEKYRREFAYASDLSYEEVFEALNTVCDRCFDSSSLLGIAKGTGP